MAETIAINVAYALYCASGLVKTEWRLRGALVVVSIAFVVWGLIAASWSPVMWNVVFGGIHTWHLYRMWKAERAISLTGDAERVHRDLFPGLTRLDFFALWSIGTSREFDPGELLIAHGSEAHDLSLVLRGQISVDRGGEQLATLGPDALLGERSYVTGQPASADVTALSGGVIHAWNPQKMQALADLYPAAHAALIGHIGVDLAAKLK